MIYELIYPMLILSVSFAADPVTFPATDWVTVIERSVVITILVLLFAISAWAREMRMSRRIDLLEEHAEQTTGRLAALGETATQAMERQTKILESLVTAFEGRVCIACENREEWEEWKREHRERQDDGK